MTMFRSARSAPLLAFLALLALAGALLFVACGDDDDDDNGTGHAAVDNDAVLNAVLFLSGAGLHDIDDAINDDKTIPANARTVAQRAQTVTLLTTWPEDLQASATALAAIFGEMAAALDGENPDLVVAGAAAKKAHDAEHDFSADVWAHLHAAAGIEGAGGGH